MNSRLILLLAATVATPVFAQERVPQEDAQKAARILSESAAAQTDLAFKPAGDLDKPRGIKADEVGLIVIPESKLTSDALAKAGKEPVPVGQLWTRIATVAKDGAVTPNSKLRLVDVTVKDQTLRLQLYLLAVRRADGGKLELVVFAKDKEPLTRVALDGTDASAEFPIEINGRKTGEESGVVTLTLLGKHKAELPLMKQAD
jgi:hypothetical protein